MKYSKCVQNNNNIVEDRGLTPFFKWDHTLYYKVPCASCNFFLHATSDCKVVLHSLSSHLAVAVLKYPFYYMHLGSDFRW